MEKKTKQLCLTLSLILFISISIGLLIGLLITLFAVDDDRPTLSSNVCETSGCVLSAALLLRSMDKSSDPCTNFYDFSCGKFADNIYLSEDKTTADPFRIQDDFTYNRIKRLLENKYPEKDLDAIEKARKMYNTCMNTDRLNELGLEPLQKLLNYVGKWPLITGTQWVPNERSFSQFIGNIIRLGFNTEILSVTVDIDETNPEIRRIIIGQPLSFNERERSYHRRSQPITALDDGDIVYFEFIQKFAIALGAPKDDIVSSEIVQMINLQNDMLEIAVSPINRLNPYKLYNKMTVRQLRYLTDNKIDWMTILRTLFHGISNITEEELVIVTDVDYIKLLPTLWTKYTRQQLTNYIIWIIIESLAEHLDTNSLEIYHDYTRKSYKTEPEPRWKYCITQTINVLEYAVGRLYIDAYVNNSVIELTNKLIDYHIGAYETMFKASVWMEEETKLVVLKKLANIKRNIGYPELLTDNAQLHEEYEKITISDNHFWNLLSNQINNSYIELKRLLKPVDKDDWTIEILVANAFYELSYNSINFPIVILTPPYLDPNTIMAVNFGAIGSTIGHEIGHAFDSYGIFYDENGVLKVWWTNSSRQTFFKKAECYVSQFNNYCPEEMKDEDVNCLDGLNTLAENIADDIGLRASLIGYRNWVKDNHEEKRLPGLEQYSPEQILFITYGYTNCENIRSESYYSIYASEVHSPGKYRTIAVARNMEEFHEAFSCSQNTDINMCRIW